MISCEARVKKWGSSMAVIIPKELARKEGIKLKEKVRLTVNKPNNVVAGLWGTAKGWDEPLEKIMKEVDEGYDDDY